MHVFLEAPARGRETAFYRFACRQGVKITDRVHSQAERLNFWNPDAIMNGFQPSVLQNLQQHLVYVNREHESLRSTETPSRRNFRTLRSGRSR